MVFQKIIFQNRYVELEIPPPSWKKNILNFHFDYLNTSLSDSVTQLTITDKLRNLNYDNEGLTLNVMIQVLQFVSNSDWQRMTWSAFAILAMFKDTNGLCHNLT